MCDKKISQIDLESVDPKTKEIVETIKKIKFLETYLQQLDDPNVKKPI